jgi:hypothetical protein
MTISEGAYRYSINKYGKALCMNHQENITKNKVKALPESTKLLQELMKTKHGTVRTSEEPKLNTITDWINADSDTWRKILNKEENKEYIITIHKQDETATNYHQYIHRRDKKHIKIRGKIGGGK